MSKLVRNLKKEGLLNTNTASFSRMLSTKTIKFETVQIILNYLDSEIKIQDKKYK